MSTATVYQGDTIPVDFTLQWNNGTPVSITGASIYVGVKSTTAAPAAACDFVIGNAAAGGSDAAVATVSAAAGTFTAYLPAASTATLTNGAKYYVGAVVVLTTGEVYTAGVAEFLVSSRVPATLTVG